MSTLHHENILESIIDDLLEEYPNTPIDQLENLATELFQQQKQL